MSAALLPQTATGGRKAEPRAACRGYSTPLADWAHPRDRRRNSRIERVRVMSWSPVEGSVPGASSARVFWIVSTIRHLP